MTKVYVDTDIVLDLLTRREPFHAAAAQMFSLAEKKEIKAFVSPLIFANLFYILRKLSTGPKAIATLKKLKLLVHVLPINDKIIESALSSAFTDFEDAVQYYTALDNGIRYLITRNKKDYKNPELIVCTAEEFMGLFRSGEIVSC